MGTRKNDSGIVPSGNRKRVKYANEKPNGDSEGVVTKRRIVEKPGEFSTSWKHSDFGITSIPVEILLEILSYLDCRDLYALREVSKFFEVLVLEPSVWTAYEVNSTGLSTSEVIDELKRMPHLRKINIEERNDCDDILRQLSCSNKRLQRLSISHCTGSSANLYLRPGYLIRILERCSRLHTITIKGSRFRGLKFYRLLGNMGHRLRFVSASTTCTQFRTFAKHVSNLDERDTDALCTMCTGTRQWGPLRYYMVERSDRTKTALVSYFYHDFLYVDVRPATDPVKTTPRVGATSLSPLRTTCS